MIKLFAETLLFTSVAINAALLIFIAGVVGKIMNDLDESAFTYFLNSLYRHSTKSVFMNVTLTIPFVGMILYFIYYGFNNWWFTAGLALWLLAGSIAKIIKVPVFKKIAGLKSTDSVQLGIERKRLQMGNTLQAALTSIATVLMAIGFFF